MIQFLNEIFVIGDAQIMNEFDRTIIPAMLEIVYPLDFKDNKVLQTNY